MHIHIVTVSSGWILQKIAERTAKACNEKVDGHTMTVSHTPDYNADANYYADLENCYGGQKTKLDIAYFTHAHTYDPAAWLHQMLGGRNAYSNLDGLVTMNRRYTDIVLSLNWPQDRVETITPGETRDMFPLRKIKIGVVSRGDHLSYGREFVKRVLSSYDFTNFKLRFLGNGWDDIMPIAEEKNIDLKITGDADYSVYPNFYESIDYLLIPGIWTAGPISFQEALSVGIPVISANVGFAGYELVPDYMFEREDEAGLARILDKIQEPILNRRRQVEHMTWEKYATDVTAFISKINKMKHDPSN